MSRNLWVGKPCQREGCSGKIALGTGLSCPECWVKDNPAFPPPERQECVCCVSEATQMPGDGKVYCERHYDAVYLGKGEGEWIKESPVEETFVRDAQRVKLEPGDVLVVTLAEGVEESQAAMDRFVAQWGKLFPDNKVVVALHGTKLQVVKAHDVEREEKAKRWKAVEAVHADNMKKKGYKQSPNGAWFKVGPAPFKPLAATEQATIDVRVEDAAGTPVSGWTDPVGSGSHYFGGILATWQPEAAEVDGELAYPDNGCPKCGGSRKVYSDFNARWDACPDCKGKP
jgi:hypothetical protein